MLNTKVTKVRGIAMGKTLNGIVVMLQDHIMKLVNVNEHELRTCTENQAQC